MQLYSVEQNRSQALEAHSGCFTTLTLGGKPTNAVVFTTKTFANGVMNSKIHCIALGGGVSHKKNAELFFPSEFADDFPVSLQIR
jgi:clathrin heavy chain